MKGKGKAVPLQAWSCPEGSRKLRFPHFMTTAQDGGKVVSLTHRSPLSPRKYTWYTFLLEAGPTPRAIVRPDGLCHWKIPMTPSGIEPATCRFVKVHFLVTNYIQRFGIDSSVSYSTVQKHKV